jgi:hypothetical protein
MAVASPSVATLAWMLVLLSRQLCKAFWACKQLFLIKYNFNEVILLLLGRKWQPYLLEG